MSAESVRVYTYHGVVEERADRVLERYFTPLSEFREHLKRLEGSRFLSVAELEDGLSSRRRGARPSVLITFDDGYANNLLAAEVLAEAKIPWCLFVPTAAIGRDRAIWTVEFALLLLKGRLRARARALETLGRSWPLTDEDGRHRAFDVIRGFMKTLPAARKDLLMEEIRSQFASGETRRLLRAHSSMRSLTWREIGALGASGVEIGSHGVSHEIHHAGQPASVRRAELVESRREIERRLRKPCRAFAFPNGDHAAARSSELVRAAGYDFGFTTSPGAARRSSDRMLLPRLEPEI